MFDKKRKLNVIPSVKDEIFLANQIDMRFYPDLFKIEFKQLNQQVDRIGEAVQQSLIINRRSIALTPVLMKQLGVIIGNVLSNYEKQHGVIRLPKVSRKKRSVKPVKKSASTAYIG